MTRKLSLRKEALTELSSADLTSVAGGRDWQTILPTCACTGYYPSIFDPCDLTTLAVQLP